MKLICLLTLILSLALIVLSIVTAPHAFEFGGYVQQAIVHIGVAGGSICALITARKVLE